MVSVVVMEGQISLQHQVLNAGCDPGYVCWVCVCDNRFVCYIEMLYRRFTTSNTNTKHLLVNVTISESVVTDDVSHVIEFGSSGKPLTTAELPSYTR